MKKKNIDYEEIFKSFIYEEFDPTNFTLLKIAHEIKTNNISTEEIYKIIDDFYRTREYDTDGNYLRDMLDHWDDDKTDPFRN